MYFVELPDIGQQKLSFYLSAEEYVADNVKESPLFFCWQVEPTVIFGRNQNVEAEVNLTYCREHGINVFRRKSGGGCVYADLGNVMLCYIVDGDDVSRTYAEYVSLFGTALRQLGFDVKATGRNDFTMEGRKVSGAAFYHKGYRNIVHSTLLFDTDFENMLQSITPPQVKLQANGVESVRSRVALLKDYSDIPLPQIITGLRSLLCGDNVIRLTKDDVSRIREIEKTYLDPDFFWGKGKHWNVERTGRIDGCGDMTVHLSVHRGRVDSMHIEGDWFDRGNVRDFVDAFRGVPLEKSAFEARLVDFPTDKYVAGLSGDSFLKLIFD